MADTEISDLVSSAAQAADELVTVRTADVAGGNRRCTAQSIADLFSETFPNAAAVEAAVNHDNLVGFVAGEHFLQSAISITASQVSDFDTEVSNNTAVSANTAKVTNATHTGDVTGATALTIAAGAVDIAMHSATGTPDATTFYRGDNTWAVPAGGGGGETNTASNIGTGVNIFDAKVGVDLQFNGIKSENSLLTVAEDTVSNDVELTVNEGSIDHDNLTNFVAGEHFLQSAISIPASQISDFDTEVGNNTAVTANTAKITFPGNPTLEHSITVEDPTSSEDISIWFTNRATTISEIRAVLIGSATPSVTWTIRHGTDRSATGAEVVTSGTTTTSTTTGSDVTTFNDATVVADSFVWLETTAQSGTVDEIHITIVYTED